MRRLLIALTILGLTACAHELPPQREPLSVAGPVYHLNASRIDVIDDYSPSPRRARTEVTPEVTLGDAMHTWAAARLVANGNVNIVELHITDADIRKKDIPKQKTGLEGMLTKEQTEEYDGKLTVELKLYMPDRTLAAARAEVTAEQSHTLKENATLAERKAMYWQITTEIMQQMDKALDRNIHMYFANYLM